MLDYRVETFLAICRAGSFTQAARELQITQPAVSQHVRILERHYGCALFAHEGRSVRLTPEGMLLHRSLATMSADARRLRRSVSSLDGQSEPLRFGATRTVAEHVMPRVLPSWGLSHPDRRLSMRVGNTQDLLGLIERERIEFALVEGSFDSRPYDSVPFSSEEFIAVGPVGAYPATSIRDLAGTPLVLREPGSGTREILERRLADKSLCVEDFDIVAELASVETVKACVAAGMGTSFLYRVAAERELAGGTLAEVTPEDFRVTHDLSLVWPRGSMFSERYRTLCAEWRACAHAR